MLPWATWPRASPRVPHRRRPRRSRHRPRGAAANGAAAAAAAAAPPPPPALPPGRELVSSALTGLVGAALAIAVVVVAALNGDASAGWLGFGPREDVVATRVVSGLYD